MRKFILIALTCIASVCPEAEAQKVPESFRKFREQIFDDYANFKYKILDHYADFLNGEWQECEIMIDTTGLYSAPKLKEAPTADGHKPMSILNKIETLETNSIEYLDNNADAEEISEATEDGYFHFDFYGMEMKLPEVDLKINNRISTNKEAAAHWEMMSSQPEGEKTSQMLKKLSEDLNLNGYLTARLTEQYVRQKFADADLNARMSAVHFLLSYMGYDIRLTQYKKLLTIMMPFAQGTVAGMPCLVKKDTGRTYYLLFPEDFEDDNLASSVRQCELPKDALGMASDLKISGLNIPFKGKKFTLTDGTLTLTGEVNENIRKLMYNYPLMPFGDYASSWIDQSLRDNLVSQLKAQLAGMSQKDAVNTLMSLCHYGFEYKNDAEWHITEKPYLVEENFLYDYNDCEDRAIFMSYLVWNALKIPCQMLKYPGHESVAVAINEDADGSYYVTDGVKYFSSDPTYRGSQIGMVLGIFEGVTPEIDKHYK